MLVIGVIGYKKDEHDLVEKPRAVYWKNIRKSLNKEESGGMRLETKPFHKIRRHQK